MAFAEPTFLEHVKDEDLPGMLFLSVSPRRMEEAADLEEASRDIPSEGESDSTKRFLEKLMKALGEKSISPVRLELRLRLLKLSTLPLHDSDNLSTFEKNFLDDNDKLSIDEEDVLKFKEIFERFNYPVPKEIKERFDAIVKNKKIPFKKKSGGTDKTFFVYAENKILMKVCNSLSQLEVYEMYRIVNEIGFEQEILPDVPLEALQETSGLKDIAFYYLVLILMRNKLMNRLYTHKINFLLVQLQQILMNNNQDYAHIDRAIAALCRYPIASNPPGLCLIFHMAEKRPGAEGDLESVKNLFENVFMYDVLVKVDPKAKDIESIISKLKPARNEFYDSLVVWFMGHGNKSRLRVKDKEIHRRRDLIEPFTKIEWFSKKPKVFFIQACANKEDKRGLLEIMFHCLRSPLFSYILTPSVLLLGGATAFYHSPPLSSVKAFMLPPAVVGLACLLGAGISFYTLPFPSADSGGYLRAFWTRVDSWKVPASEWWQMKYADYTDVSTINCFADTLVSYATMWYQSAARGSEGSLYVQTLVDQLHEYGREESIENVLRRVHYNVNAVNLLSHVPGEGQVLWKQAPYFESSLLKEFIFPKNLNH